MIHPTYHLLAPAILSTLLSAGHPRVLPPPNNRQSQGHCVTDEQCIHTSANMITPCLGNNYITLVIHYTLKTLLQRFPCGCNINTVIYKFSIYEGLRRPRWSQFASEIYKVDTIVYGTYNVGT